MLVRIIIYYENYAFSLVYLVEATLLLKVVKYKYNKIYPAYHCHFKANSSHAK